MNKMDWFFPVVALIIFIVSVKYNHTISVGEAALFVIAMLPLISRFLENVNMPGVVSLQFKKEVKDTLDSQQTQLDQQKIVIEKQQQIINEIVIYSMSHGIFCILRELYHRKINGGEYLFRNNEITIKDLRFLRDHGYLEQFATIDLKDGENLVNRLDLTPVGKFYVEQREKLNEKKRKEKDSCASSIK
jgi:hypothetical protein